VSAAKILVVDDEPSIVDAVATALRYEGFQAAEAATGRDALAAAASDEPDLIVLDWMLPDLEGIEVGRRLREGGLERAILFLTAKDAVSTRSRRCAPAATTISRSLSASRRSWLASRRSSAVARARSRVTSFDTATSHSTSPATR
jgi:CheY-like chemotaxis protein